MVKTGEDDDPIAVMTALSTKRYADKAFMQQAKDFLLKKCPDEGQRQHFQQVGFSSKGCGRG